MINQSNFFTQWLARRLARQDADIERLFQILAIGTLSKRRTF